MILVGCDSMMPSYIQVVGCTPGTILGFTASDAWFDECTTADPWHEVTNWHDTIDPLPVIVDDKEAHRLKMEAIPGKFKPVVIKPPSTRHQFRSKKLYECRRRNHSF